MSHMHMSGFLEDTSGHLAWGWGWGGWTMMGPGESLRVKAGVLEEAVNMKRTSYKYVCGMAWGEHGGNELGPTTWVTSRDR